MTINKQLTNVNDGVSLLLDMKLNLNQVNELIFTNTKFGVACAIVDLFCKTPQAWKIKN